MLNLNRIQALLVLALLPFGMLYAEDETFANPVFAHDWPDPTVWRGDDSLYYSFSTAGTSYAGRRGKFLYSADMVTWDTIPDYVWTTETLAQLRQYGSNQWAPQVTRIGGQWLMYLTCYGTSASDPSIVVLSLDSETFPTAEGLHGPWKFRGVVTSSRENKIRDTIDPFVVEDEETGRVWMFFGSTGGNYRVELTADGLHLADDAEFVHVAGLTYAEDTSRSRVFEGAYLYYRDGYWYYFVSSGLYSNYTYDVQVGRSPSLDGTFVNRAGLSMTEGYATVLLSTTSDDKDYFGPGHCGEIFEDEEGRTYIYYHCHAKDVPITVPGYTPRALMLQQIMWDEEGWPYFENDKPVANEVWPAVTLPAHDLQIVTVESPDANIYSIMGQRVKTMSRGFFMVRYPDGTVRKYFVTE